MTATAEQIEAGLLAYAPPTADEAIGELLERLKDRVIPDRPIRTCRELARSETECIGGRHYTGPRTVGRRCPEAVREEVRTRIPAEAERLSGLLAKAGYRRMHRDDRRDIGKVLRQCLEPRPEVKGLSAMLRMLDVCADKPLERNVMLQGDLGLGKTTAQLCLYFSQLALGVNARYLQSSDLRAVAVRRQSADPEAAEEAEQKLRQWQAARVLVWSDIGDKDERDRNFAPTVQDLLENFGGVLLGSTNLDREKLADSERCPNIGPRAVDRMFADYRGLEAFVIELKGPRQRRAAR